MSSIFSFRREQPPQPQPEPGETPAPEAENLAGNEEAATAFDIPAAPEISITPAIDIQPFLKQLTDILKGYLPANVAGMPANSVDLVELQHRSLGLGNRRGTQTYHGMDVAELRGGRLDAVIRFDFWAADPAALTSATTTLQARLLTDSLTLRKGGILQLRQQAVSDTTTTTPPRSRRFLDYSVLYEYQYADSGGAAGLIARVPVHSDADALPGTQEQTEIRDWMVLWDSGGAPALEITPGEAAQVYGSLPIGVLALTVAAYLPAGGPSGQVSITQGSTTIQNFASLSAFLAACTSAGSLALIYPPLPLQPGETLTTHDFQVKEFRFSTPIILKGGSNSFKISFSQPNFPAANLSQVYIRALPGPVNT